MARYIRTKEGIFEVEKEKLGFYCCKGLEMAVAPFDEEFVSQADTVEQLCDALIIKDAFYHITDFVKEDKYDYDRVLSFESCYNGFGKHIGKNVNVYGAIWIIGDNKEPILKSVARMNDKGELELL